MWIRWLSFIILLFWGSMLSAQGLFGKAQAGQEQERPYELNGYLRSVLFAGKIPEINDAEIKSGYGEFSLKLKAAKNSFGNGYAEIRFRRGYEFGKYISEFNLREAYVNTYVGPFDFRVGHQIVVWGRADGINPTDNITPKNMLARSPDEDDRREGNFLLRSHINVHPVRIEAIWVPFFRSSVIPTDLLHFPPSITLRDPDYPGSELKNSAFAFKVDLELAAFDGSLSYFNGHNPFPGISAFILQTFAPGPFIEIFPKSYRMHVLGADFSTTVAGSFGLRGEMAYRNPHEDYEKNAHIPNPDLQYIIGIDKEIFSNVSMVLQYMGRYVIDFTELKKPKSPSLNPLYELEFKNRMIAFQQHELSHSLFCRAEWKQLHETLRLEIAAMGNLTTEEFLLRPKVAYDIADALTFILGGELYSGPNDTLFGSIDAHLSAVFTELKISF